MAINPMQRKARNSFLLGMLIMLVIAAIVVIILVMAMSKMNQREQLGEQNAQEVYRLITDIKSGQEISISDLEKVSIGTYKQINTKTNQPAKATDNKSDVERTSVATGLDASQLLTPASIEGTMIAKVDLPKGIFLTTSMVTPSDEKVTDDLRVQEFNMILLPTDLEKEDFVDIRLRFQNGQDYIVVAKKRILKSSSNTIFVKMTEDEILSMSNAIVEAYTLDGSLLYADKYESAGLQKAATPTYNVSRDVLALINENPNIVETARNALWARYKAELRLNVDTMLSGAEDATEKVTSGVDQQIQRQQQERARYIDTLGTGADY